MELFYNPERMSETEIKETFVAYQWLVDEILSILKRQPKGAGVQHVVIVAPRGMGKTTLLLMLRFAALNTEIAKRWQPVLFPEESYGVYDLADLWVDFLNHIASETGDAGLRDEVSQLKVSHPKSDDLEAVALAKIKDWRKKNKKRFLMLLDNFDMILEQIDDEKDNASLRDVLMNDDTLMLVGGSTTFFKEARAYDQPLYNLFKIYNLDGLDSEQIEELLRRRAKLDGVENFEEILRANRTRLRVLEYFTGGNPRLVLMLYRVITHSQISDVRHGLEKLLDEVTPYYKAKIESLPPQQRKILDQIARITGQTREGLTPSEIAPATRLPVNQVSAQLKRLADLGYVRMANIPGRSSYYTLSEPLYAIWHQMRFSRETRKRMNWLIEFLKGWYDAKELGRECKRLENIFRNYLNAGREREARDVLEHRRYLMEAIEDHQSRARTLEDVIQGYSELGDIETLQSIEQIIELYPDSSDAHYLRGHLLIELNSDEALNSLKRAFDPKSSSHRRLVETLEGKSVQIVVALVTEDFEQLRTTWRELAQTATEKEGQAGWVKRALAILAAMGEAGHWDLVRELIASSNLDEQLFPLVRALNYLLKDDETTIEKLSPEVRRIVDEIVSALKDTPGNNGKPKKRVKSKTSSAKRKLKETNKR